MTAEPFSIRNISSSQRANLIAQAHERLLIYAPGLSALEIEALQAARRNLLTENIHLYLDISQSSFMSGYWQGQDPVDLHECITNTLVRNAFQARLGLIIVDDRAVVFTPPLPRVEAEPDGAEANALVFNPEMTELLWRSVVIRVEVRSAEKTVIAGDAVEAGGEAHLIPERPQVTAATLEGITLPASISPERERILNGLRSQLKLVRLHLKGLKIENRKFQLPKSIVDLLGSDNQEITDHLNATWGILTEKSNRELREKRSQVEETIERIRSTFLQPLRHYGSGLLCREEKNFIQSIEELEKMLEEVRTWFKQNLATCIEQSKERLVDLILERARERKIKLPGPQIDFFHRDDEDRQRWAAQQLADEVNWPSASDLAKDIELEWSIDDLTESHLNRPDFIKAIEKAYHLDLTAILGTTDAMNI